MAAQRDDLAREPQRWVKPYKNLDLPPEAFSSHKEGITNVTRPGFNTTGREVELFLNAYPITKFPAIKVFQYDVTIVKVGKEHEIPTPRARKAVWDSSIRKNRFKQILFDGSKLAWSSLSYDDPSGLVVNLSIHTSAGNLIHDKINESSSDSDSDSGHGETTNTHTFGYRLMVRKSKAINLEVLQQWLANKGPFDESVLEALNFLDHLMRECPSTKYTAVKRAFFDPNESGHNFDSVIDVYKGFYQAIRPALGGRLVVNVDSVLCTFWRRLTLVSLADSLLSKFDWTKTAQALRPKYNPRHPSHGYRYSEEHKHVWNKMKGLEVRPVYEGCQNTKIYKIFSILPFNAHEYTFNYKNPATGSESKISIYEYFKMKHNVTLFIPELPVIEMTGRNGVFPMECVELAGLQRYTHRLNERQTADMIKVAVRKPQFRFGDIAKAKEKLGHFQDPILKHFGMEVSPNMLVTKARLLPTPEIQFANNVKLNPHAQGRWDLRGKKFLETNKLPLKSWGIGIINQGRATLTIGQAEDWALGFMKQYCGHGGKVVSHATILELTGDTAEGVKRLFIATGNNVQQRPQLLFFVVSNKDTLVYNRIKRSCDCRFGVPSQVVQRAHVEKKMPQYMSNIAMKVNAKLGGVTCKAAPRQQDIVSRPGTIIIGADVSHAAPGSMAPSLTAISVSADQIGIKYMGKCETGESRVEIINEQNMADMLTPLVDEWVKTVGNGRRPQQIYYFRDGVATGQFAHVLEQEVPIIKAIVHKGSGEKTLPKITVVIANKRHHIRGAPRPNDKVAGDKNGNALPGTLIERDVTSPHDWDFLLISHVALQGTAKPVHYHVIRDELNHKPAQLQNMIYNHCYQYVRSTTSVSLFPAVYYAHLISNRARCQSAEEYYDDSEIHPQTAASNQSGPKPLLPMVKNETRNHLEMWFV